MDHNQYRRQCPRPQGANIENGWAVRTSLDTSHGGDEAFFLQNPDRTYLIRFASDEEIQLLLGLKKWVMYSIEYKPIGWSMVAAIRKFNDLDRRGHPVGFTK